MDTKKINKNIQNVSGGWKTCGIGGCQKLIHPAGSINHWRWRHPIEYENYFGGNHDFGFMQQVHFGTYERLPIDT